MRPEWVDFPGVSKNFHSATLIGSTQIDQRANRRRLPVDTPVLRKKASGRGWITPARQMISVSLSETLGGGVECRQIFMVKTCPDFLLPQTVEVLDDCLEADLQRRGKNGSYSQGQTKAHDSADNVRMIMTSLKTHIVVKLGEGWKPVALPMSFQSLENKGRRGHSRRPRFGQRTPQRASGEQLEKPQVLHPQIFHNVEAIQFDPLLCKAGQIPTRRGCRAPNPALTVQQALAPEDAPNGAHAGRFGQIDVLTQRLTNGLCADKTQGTCSLQLLAHETDLSLQSNRCFVGNLMRRFGSATPINFLQWQNTSALHPALDGMQRNSETTGHGSLRMSAPNQRNHFLAFTLLTFSSRELLNQSPLVDSHALSST